jgi:hypothetical protein
MPERGRRLAGVQGPQMPQQLADSRRAAQQIAMQRQVSQMPTAPGTPPVGPEAAAQLGQQAAQERGQIATQQMAQQGQQAVQAGQAQVQGEAVQAQQAAQERGLDRTRIQRDLENEFSQMARGAKSELYDRGMQIQRDETNQAILNERQLIDFALSKGVSEEQWKDYEQAAFQATQRELQMMEAAMRTIEQRLQQESQKSRTEINQNLQRELAEAKAALERSIQRKQARAANRGAIFSGVGMIAGAAVMAPAGPAGMAVGAQAGGGAGSLAGALIK